MYLNTLSLFLIDTRHIREQESGVIPNIKSVDLHLKMRYKNYLRI